MNKPFQMTLTKRIWLCFVLLECFIGLIIIIVYPYSIQNTLKENTFRTIEAQQLLSFQRHDESFAIDNPGTDNKSGDLTRTIIVDKHLKPITSQTYLETDVFNQMRNQIKHQYTNLARYELKQNGSTLYFVVRRVKINMVDDGYLISYMWDTYDNELKNNLWNRLIFIFVMVSILSLFLAFWLARYLKRPLDILGRRFKEISRLNWEKPFEWKGDVEYERLSAQFEEMRLNLINYDQSQKVFLQQASHELKTPIMIVQSYAQSVKDGIYPKGGLDDSMDIIIEESQQMEKRVRKLLYFTRFDSIGDKQMRFSKLQFGELAEPIRERFRTQRTDLDIHISGEETELYVDKEQMLTVLENLVENGLRYAKSGIWLEAAGKSNVRTVVTVRNDGPQIPDHELKAMFKPFEKGEKGQFGLGLAIVKRIVHNHHGVIYASNRKDGVAFEMTLPVLPLEGKDK
ncbi:sensor histidine kinase [Sporolactobacillus terrae]|uniref:histidine kinase n=1 Tax=Sporolactobacillus terrae TaxID=269673 RepID=A0ABX5Q920_9BACL|nr:HAMP domain-containing sensor histidine kinase [Sporolactobacillus terrae]QAA23105.1 sensor histidine kinase [Sporolactobacillus terrae]QAA26076.1 sensor histidine kinase [Sporolactobacillus terrae]UAK15172.1 HAMP domain-containing histidine kinase [Sporolactobacillus terrae]